MDSIIKVRSFLLSHLLFIAVGLGCELVYIFYFVRQFPLLSYYQQLTDIGGITNHSFTGLTQFIVAFIVLFALLGLALWEGWSVYRTITSGNRATLWLILAFGVLFTCTMSFVYPGTAIDIFAYIAQNMILIQHHANPMIMPPTSFPGDPMMALAGGWSNATAPYGPLGLLIDAIPTLIVGRTVLANLLLLKFMFSAMLLVEAYLAYKILSSYAPRFALVGAIFIAWNPYTLFEYSTNGHNDIVAMLFVLLAVLALVKDRPALAFALIITSVLVKYTTALLVPLFFIYSLIHLPDQRSRLRYLLQIIVISLLIIAITFGPFWTGPHTLDSVLIEDQYILTSFCTMLSEITAASISFDQGKLIGRIIFGVCYLYALYLSTRSLPEMLRGCFIALFCFLAFGSAKFEFWYALWPTLMAILTARQDKLLAAFLLTLGATLSNSIFQFLFTQMGASGDAFMFSNSLSYIMSFFPALLLLGGFALWKLFSMRKRKSEIEERT